MILTIGDTKSGSSRLLSPSWSDVEAAIRAMDGNTRSELGLFVDEDTFLQVGGGGGKYTCCVRAEGKLHVLTDPNRTSDETVWLVAGQGDDVSLNECFPADMIIEVSKCFWEHRTVSPRYHWHSY